MGGRGHGHGPPGQRWRCTPCPRQRRRTGGCPLPRPPRRALGSYRTGSLPATGQPTAVLRPRFRFSCEPHPVALRRPGRRSVGRAPTPAASTCSGIRNSTTYTTSDGISGNLVRCVFESPQGELWIGTDGAGLNRRTSTGFAHISTAEGLSSNVILSLAGGAGGDLWIGTPDGLNLLHRSGPPIPSTALRSGRDVKFVTQEEMSSRPERRVVVGSAVPRDKQAGRIERIHLRRRLARRLHSLALLPIATALCGSAPGTGIRAPVSRQVHQLLRHGRPGQRLHRRHLPLPARATFG